MASATPSQQSAAIANYVETLRQARARPGYVTVPPNVGKDFEVIFRQRHDIEANDVEAVVTIIDSDDGNLSRRLDQRSLFLFCGILRLSVECRSQLRGYCLLAECLHDASATDDPASEKFSVDKVALGVNHMFHAFSKFLDSNRSEPARRAYGLFVLTLIRGCPENKKRMQDQCNDMELSSLGQIVLGQDFEILKITAACIIHEILGRGLPEGRIWPIDDMSSDVLDSFPKYRTPTYQWMWDLHCFFEKTNLQGPADERRAVSVFANTIQFAGKTFEFGDHSTILVTLNTMLSIMVPARNTQPTFYIDIPLDGISRFESHIKTTESDTQSQHRSERSQSQSRILGCLNINLSTRQDWSQLLNYKPCHASAIAMVFDYETDLRIVERALEARRSVPANTISPSLLEYEPMTLRSETTTARSDSVDDPLNREESDSTEEQSTRSQKLSIIASDAITCMAEEATYDDAMHTLGGRHTPPSQVQDKQASPNDRNNGNPNVNTKSAKRPVNNSRPRGSQGSRSEGRVQGRIDNGEFKASNHTGSRRKREISKVPAVETPGKASAQRQPSEHDMPYGSSPERSQTKRLPHVRLPSALAAQRETQQPRVPGHRDSRLSRQLRDHDGRLADSQLAPSPDQNPSRAHTGDPTKRTSVTERSASTKRLPEPRVMPAGRDTKNTKTRGLPKTTAKLRFGNEKREPKGTSIQKGKESRMDRVPEASMIAESKDKQASRKGFTSAITSNSSRPRPKAEAFRSEVSNHVSKPKTKRTNLHDEEEQVDWSEAFQVDDGSDFALPSTKTKITKNRSIPTKLKKGKTGLTQRMEALPTKLAPTVTTGKPRRAAAVKADKRIQGLADSVEGESDTPKKSPVEKVPYAKPTSSHVESPMKISEKSKRTSLGDHPLRPANGRSLARNPKALTLSKDLAEGAEYQQGQAPDSVQRRVSRHPALLTATESVSPQAKTMNPDIITPIGAAPIDSAASPEVIANTVNKPDRQQPSHEAPMGHRATDSLVNEIAGDISNIQHLSDPKLKALAPQIAQTFTASTREQYPIPDDVSKVTFDVPTPIIQPEHNSKKVMIDDEAGDDHGDLGSGVFADFGGHEELVQGRPPPPMVTQDGPSLSQKSSFWKGNRQQQQDQASREEETKVFLAPTKKRLIASMLEAALSPIPALQSQEEESEPRRKIHAAQRIQDFGETRAEVQEPNANISHDIPKEDNSKARQKRPSGEMDPRQAKKSKVAGSKPHISPHMARAQIQTPKKKLLAVSKKPNLIHFDASGPRNQGVRSTEKSKAPAQTPVPSRHGGPPSEATQSHKRKLSDAVDDSSVAARHHQPGKRLKIDHSNPIDMQVKKPIVPSTNRQMRVHSSQNSRVDEFGSPLPFHHRGKSSLVIPNATAPVVKISPPLNEVSDTDDLVDFPVEFDTKVEPKLPVAQHGTQPKLTECKLIVASNRKHRPSSPNAPGSIITDMTAHTVQPSGHFLGLQTNDVVVPQRPKDPFIEMAQDRPISKFMETLRRSSITHGQKEEANRSKQNDDKDNRNNDPDKTLIGEPGSPGDDDSDTTSGSSSSSHSSDSQHQSNAEASDDESEPHDAWKKALKTHQRDIFDQLYEIGHQLTQGLVDKETAIRDLVEDYRKQGHAIINQFEKERQCEFAFYRSEREKANGELIKIFQSVGEDCAIKISESEKGMIDFKLKMETRQTKAQAAMDGLMALFDKSE